MRPAAGLALLSVFLILCLGQASAAQRGLQASRPSYGAAYASHREEPEEEDSSKSTLTMFLSLTFLIAVTVAFETLKVTPPSAPPDPSPFNLI